MQRNLVLSTLYAHILLKIWDLIWFKQSEHWAHRGNKSQTPLVMNNLIKENSFKLGGVDGILIKNSVLTNVWVWARESGLILCLFPERKSLIDRENISVPRILKTNWLTYSNFERRVGEKRKYSVISLTLARWCYQINRLNRRWKLNETSMTHDTTLLLIHCSETIFLFTASRMHSHIFDISNSVPE